MIPELEKLKLDLIDKYGTEGVKNMMLWCSAFLKGYEFAKKTEKGDSAT